MNTIGIDAHAIGLQQGGNERYAEGLLKGLSEINTHDFKFTVFLNEKAQVPDFLNNNPTFEFRKVSAVPVKRFIFDLPRNIKKYRIDLIHMQYHVPFRIDIPSVITLHDVSYLAHPEFFPIFERLKMKLMMPYSIKKAKKIITVSEFSKKEISKLYKYAPGKIYTIYNGISDYFKPATTTEIQQTLEKYQIRNPYILTVSNLQPRKNLKGLIESFSNILRKDRKFPCCLVIVGKKLWLYDDIFAGIRNSEFKEKIFITGYLNDTEIISLYSGAEMFVYVSFYEGFGFPPIEAMACGCPVITSNTSSLPEITGDACIHVNPENSEEIASAIVQLYQNKSLKENLIGKGFMQAKKFSWSKCAKKTIDIYKEVLCLL
ncbi:MAG: glycosyltransferase family 4 protein [Candidatus Omnitrophica bacterium]|nr:glycosyltransferase family 4 protein [Candidatus Omnitrophota bacterium]MCM8788364.1 glycosyltransferase family 4 protein [Candidatus Omnitrophota bacterium]